MMDFLLKKKKTILVVSLALVAISAAAILIFGFKLGIDFTSGSLWQIKTESVNEEGLRDFFRDELGIEDIFQRDVSLVISDLESLAEVLTKKYGLIRSDSLSIVEEIRSAGEIEPLKRKIYMLTTSEKSRLKTKQSKTPLRSKTEKLFMFHHVIPK